MGLNHSEPRAIPRPAACDAARRLEPHFRRLQARGKIDYRKLTAEGYGEIVRVLEEMARVVHEKAHGEDRAIAVHLVEALARSHEFLFSAYQGSNDVRDRHLADNAMRAPEFLGAGARFSIWAHNAHIASDPEYYGEGGASSMGEHLRQRLGRDYYRVGTAFTRGGFVAVTIDKNGRDTAPQERWIELEAPAGSVNWLLEQGACPRYLLPLRQIPSGGPLHAFLDEERGLLGVGDCWAGELGPHLDGADRRVRVLRAFDAIFYFTDTGGVLPVASGAQ